MKFLSSKPKKLVMLVTAAIVLQVSLVAYLIPPVWQLKDQAIKIYRYKDPEKFHERGPHEWSWQPIDHISKYTQYAVVSAEDSRFFEHSGIDVRAILASLRVNFEQGKIARGGSTITQQLVKLAFLDHERTYLRKIREALGAVALEMIMSKEDILEWYLNLVPFGNGKVGIREAAKLYFEDPPEHLGIVESIQLALVIPRPGERAKDIQNKELTQLSQIRFARIAKQMLDDGIITDHQFQEALLIGNFGRPIHSRTL